MRKDSRRVRDILFQKLTGRKNRRSRLMMTGAAFVVFMTVWAMILPALALESRLARNSSGISLDDGISMTVETSDTSGFEQVMAGERQLSGAGLHLYGEL